MLEPRAHDLTPASGAHLPLPATASEPQVEVVRELPLCVKSHAAYSFAKLTRADVTEGNHALHKYPAKFIPQIPRWALSAFGGAAGDRVLDPFVGSGTTLLEALTMGRWAAGTDICPVAVTVSRAKVAMLSGSNDSYRKLIARVTASAKVREPAVLRSVETGDREDLHETWSYWFDLVNMARLLSVREAILAETTEDDAVRPVMLSVLSAVMKSCSRLSEDQIKVRLDSTKQQEDPFIAWPAAVERAIERQKSLTERGAPSKPFEVVRQSATDLPWKDGSFDRVVTSPPYLNAIDYSMTHKYNMFLLGDVQPSGFKEHCRRYIGVTERAVRTSDSRELPITGQEAVDALVAQLAARGEPVARNRAYIIAQYFSGMNSAIGEMHRVLRAGGLTFMVVGESNRICGITVPTGALVRELFVRQGFRIESEFFHVLANRSSMRLNRNELGGSVAREVVLVCRK